MNICLNPWLSSLGTAGLWAQFNPPLGYVGPAGIGALGVLLVVVLVLFVGLFGLVLYPLRLILARRRRLREQKNAVPEAAAPSPLEGKV